LQHTDIHARVLGRLEVNTRALEERGGEGRRGEGRGGVYERAHMLQERTHTYARLLLYRAIERRREDRGLGWGERQNVTADKQSDGKERTD
jgi:hypothetical protein